MRLDENAFSATLLVVGAAGGSASSLSAVVIVAVWIGASTLLISIAATPNL